MAGSLIRSPTRYVTNLVFDAADAVVMGGVKAAGYGLAFVTREKAAAEAALRKEDQGAK